MNRGFGVGASVLALGLLLGCSAPEPLVALHDSIVNGEASDETEDGVVKIYAGVEALCSAALIAPNVLITARHCVSHYNHAGTFSCSVEGVLTTQNPGDGQLGATVNPASIQVHAGVDPDTEVDAVGTRVFGTDSLVICQEDIALVILDRELALPVFPVRLARQTHRGERMRVVGYGVNAQGDVVERYRRGGRVVLDVRPDPDDPSRKRTAPNTFVLDEGACQGDSGGPAISEETGAVTGVYSLSAASSCESPTGVRNVYTQVAPFAALVEQALEAAGATPQIEPDWGAAGDGSGGAGGGESRAGGSGALASAGTEVAVGSGSRRDSSCALHSAKRRTKAEHLGALGLFALMALLVRRPFSGRINYLQR